MYLCCHRRRTMPRSHTIVGKTYCAINIYFKLLKIYITFVFKQNDIHVSRFCTLCNYPALFFYSFMIYFFYCVKFCFYILRALPSASFWERKKIAQKLYIKKY